MTDAAHRRRDQAGEAVRRATRQMTALVRSCPQPARTPATSTWTVADTTAHVLSIALLYVALVDSDAAAPPVPDLETRVAQANVDTVGELNAHVLRHLTERDAGVLCDGLVGAVDHLVRVTAKADPGAAVRWLGGASVTHAGLLAHLTNELLIHGWDIAKATDRPWTMPEADAALFLDLFFFDMVRLGHGRLIETAAPRPARRITVAFRSAYTRETTVALTGGRVTVVPPGSPVDVRVTYRPARFNLMMFGRISTLSAVLRRDVVIGGPRPWLLLPFLRVVHMPRA